MHARATRPHIQNNCQYTWTYAINSGGTICSSLPIITNRISLFLLAYLIVVSVPAENHIVDEPFMPALMKASSNITVHYRNSICTITAVQTTLSYVIETTYSRNTAKCGGGGALLFIPCYWPYTPNIINLSWYVGSISSRPLLEKQRSVRITDGKANSPVSWGSLPSYLTIEDVVIESKVGLCINLSLTEM
jgi:hypothetical protein